MKAEHLRYLLRKEGSKEWISVVAGKFLKQLLQNNGPLEVRSFRLLEVCKFLELV